jgi:hypothetical protein
MYIHLTPTYRHISHTSHASHLSAHCDGHVPGQYRLLHRRCELRGLQAAEAGQRDGEGPSNDHHPGERTWFLLFTCSLSIVRTCSPLVSHIPHLSQPHLHPHPTSPTHPPTHQLITERSIFQAVASIAVPFTIIHTAVDVGHRVTRRFNAPGGCRGTGGAVLNWWETSGEMSGRKIDVVFVSNGRHPPLIHAVCGDCPALLDAPTSSHRRTNSR